LWDVAFQKLEKTMPLETLCNWMEVAATFDVKGLMRLDLQEKAREMAFQVQLQAFKFDPKFSLYTSIVEKLGEPRQGIRQQLFNWVLEKRDHFEVMVRILHYEKRYEELKNEIKDIPSDTFVREMTVALASLEPRSVIDRACIELKATIAESLAALELRFMETDHLKVSFEEWRKHQFKSDDDEDEDMPDDHYLVQLVEKFGNFSEEDNTYGYRDCPPAHEQTKFEDREDCKKLDELVGWLFCVKEACKHISLGNINHDSACNNNNTDFPTSFAEFVNSFQQQSLEYIKTHQTIPQFSIICEELAKIGSYWPLNPELEDLMSLNILFAAICRGALLKYLELSRRMAFYEKQYNQQQSGQAITSFQLHHLIDQQHAPSEIELFSKKLRPAI